MKKIIPALLSIFILFSCGKDKEKKQVEDHSISFRSKTVEKKLKDCHPENGKCTFISLTFPFAENGEGQPENINKSIQDFMGSILNYQEEDQNMEVDELVENFIKNYKQTTEDFPETEMPWEATIIGKVILNTPELISIQFDTDMFTGGAHGYRSTSYLNFDPATGDELENTDLFTSEFKEFVENDFREKFEIAQDSNINSTGLWFEEEQFSLPANIGVSKDSILLIYNAYEVSSYAEGSINMSFSRPEADKYLNLKEINSIQ
ncbi:DUF3298 and DUF4163 domain-containing protein [Gramella sp. AN32]|uniref:PdaC/SigV domain-containing protein n=1 Tax=Christiangramia antarctica TaxID=2058158 RepID=A0ABW5X0K9_9FLAO|nr:DUF3298 and DUF4163 domain-containing protein [Gramella sp. AN32]MCM4154868.1 hypothetical protein [Gramella sp. AN32]